MAVRSIKKNITGAQIAMRLGLSPTTVSMVLNGHAERYCIAKSTAKRIKTEAKKLNYRPSMVARQLVGMRSNAVGVLINTRAAADPRLLQEMELLAADRGIRFIVGHAVGTQDRVSEYLDDFYSRGVDGIISIFHNHPDYSKAVLPKLAQFERVVYCEKPVGGAASKTSKNVCYVEPDFFEAGRLAVEHLIGRGRRRIAIVLNHLLFPFARDRLAAYKEVLNVAGRQIDERLIWVLDQQPSMCWTDPFTMDTALQVVDNLVIEQGADGIVLVDDIYAAWVVAALRRRGRRVPDDVAVVSCNDLDIGPLIDPPLTAVSLCVPELARATMDMLFELLDHDTVSKDRRAVVIKPKLIERDSS